MDFIFENQGSNTYLVYRFEVEDEIDTMSLGMLTNNKIPGIAPAFYAQMDTKKSIKYNVSSRVSVRQFFIGPVNKKRLLGVFKGIVNALISAEDFMISEESILLDLDYIFADVSTCETVLICLPIQSSGTQHDLGAFFKNIMFSTQFDQTENCDHVAQIINYLNSTPMLNLADFKELLDKVEGMSVAPAVRTVVNVPTQQPTMPTTEQTSKPNKQVSQPKVSVVEPKASIQPAQIPNTPVAPVPVPPVAPIMSGQAPVQIPNAGAMGETSALQSTSQQESMSWLYLMQHYNKENAEIYKAQKNAKKGTPKQATPTQPKPAKQPKPSKGNKNMPTPGFAVPGQGNGAGFAIPGQNAPQGFAVSGQPTPSQNAKVSQPIPQPVPAGGQRPPMPQVPQQPGVQPQVVQPIPQPAVQPVAPVKQAPFTPIAPTVKGQSANFGETTVLGGSAVGETSVLSATNNPNKMIAPHLIRQKNNEKISLNKPVFRVGKEKSYVDYFVGDNTAISRSHANFITRDGAYLVVDTNSTNHTFVNGKMIQSNEETPIVHGDVIRLANEDFEFKLY